MQPSKKKECQALFCMYMANGYAPEEAARRAGYPLHSCGREAACLLGKKGVRKKIRVLAQELYGGSALQPARAALNRIAFGGAGDIRAVLQENPEDIPRNPDLFCVSEIKRGKNGVEVKFYDRLAAISMLAELEGRNDSQNTPLIDALQRSAGAIGGEMP